MTYTAATEEFIEYLMNRSPKPSGTRKAAEDFLIEGAHIVSIAMGIARAHHADSDWETGWALPGGVHTLSRAAHAAREVASRR